MPDSPVIAPILLRKNLLCALQQALTTPLVVLSAPAGYGKTLAAKYLAESLPCAVQHLTVPQNALSAAHIWESLRRQWTLSPEAGAFSQYPWEETVTWRVIRFLEGMCAQKPLLLVLDDWQHVRDAEMYHLLYALVHARIEGLHLLVCSRSLPELPPEFSLSEWRMKGQCAVFGVESLAFSQEEARACFAAHGIDDHGAADAAWQRTEGWPAALWLAARAYGIHGASAAVHTAHDLFESVIFPSYSDEDKRLLLQLGVLEHFTGKEAALLTEQAQTPQRLRQLHRQNTFLYLDENTGVWRLHSLFRDFLLGQLALQPDMDTVALTRRAAECCIEQQNMVGAARFLLEAGRDEDMLRLLEIFLLPGGNMLPLLMAEELSPKVVGLAWAIKDQRPLEYLAFLYFCLTEADDMRAVALLDEAAEHFAGLPHMPVAQKWRLAGEMVLIRSMLAYNDLWAMYAAHEEAHALLNGRSSIASRGMVWNFACPHGAAPFLREPGTYSALVDLVEDKLHFYQELADGCSAGGQLLGRAEYLLEKGLGLHPDKGVEGLLLAARQQAQCKEQLSTLLCVAFTRARLALERGQPEEATALLLEYSTAVGEAGSLDMEVCLDLCFGYIHALSNNAALIPAWLREGVFSRAHNIPQIFGFIQCVHARVVLQSGHWQKLDALAKALPGHIGAYENLFLRIHALVCEAVAAQHLHGLSVAVPLLHKALALAAPDGIVQSIAEYGAHVLPIFRDMVRQKETAATLDQDAVSLEFLASVSAQVTVFARQYPLSQRARTGLTARENEVMRLAARGMRNAEIASRLNIQPDTVNKTLRTAYQRLDAQNRADAVRRFLAAQERGG